jgi:hypothetical protein
MIERRGVPLVKGEFEKLQSDGWAVADCSRAPDASQDLLRVRKPSRHPGL